MSFRYRNPWFAPVTGGDPQFYVTEKKPIEYRGFLIFNRHRGCHELVKDGVCLTQRVGGGSLRALADALLGDKSDEPACLVERARSVGSIFGVQFIPAPPY